MESTSNEFITSIIGTRHYHGKISFFGRVTKALWEKDDESSEDIDREVEAVAVKEID